MKLTLKTIKPRNPFVAAARSRLAGAHQPSAGALRQRAEQALRRDLSALQRLRPEPSP